MLVQGGSAASRMKSAEDQHTFSCTQAASVHQFSTHQNRNPTHYLFKNKLCGRPPQYAPAPCKLTFWPWKWCLSHVWCGLHLCQF